MIITGTNFRDDLNGTVVGDEINGLGGSDTIRGQDGNDTLDGGSGNDTLYGGAGNDTFLIRANESARDVIFGGDGVDTLKLEGNLEVSLPQRMQLPDVERFEGNGHDVLGSGGAEYWDFSNFTSVTGLGKILALRGFDQITGSFLNDYIDLGGGDDWGWGGNGNDTILGGTGLDRMFGGDGNDYFELGTFADVVDAGAGNDRVLVRARDDYTDSINGGSGIDTIEVDTRLVVSGGNPATNAIVTLNGLQRITNFEVFDGSGQIVRGTNSNNLLDFGNRFASTINVDAIEGLNGSDTIIGGSLGDTIDGGFGSDNLTGRAGNDVFRFIKAGATSIGADVITDFNESGNDVMRLVGFVTGAGNLQGATSFDAGGATIDLSDLGGAGSIRLLGVHDLAFTGGTDFTFG